MPDYSDQEARKARRIVERLLDVDQEAPDIEDMLVVSDIESDAAEFVAEMRLLEAIGVDAPAVRVGEEELVPVALSLIAGTGWQRLPPMGGGRSPAWHNHPFFHELAYDYFRSFFEERERFPAFATISREHARSTFLKRASEFLATRLAAVNEYLKKRSNRWAGLAFLNMLQRTGGPRILTPGCHFSVSTNTTGLRVFWSGAYRVSPNYFSHPTTPTVGVLQSGTYVFGVDGGAYGNQIQWDLNAVVSLPGRPHAHLNY
jgi:hypothetical protein